MPTAAESSRLSDRNAATIFGALMIGTFVTSIVGLILYQPLLDHTNYVLGAGHDTQIEIGAFLEVGLVITNIGTAVVLYPVLRRYQQTLALSWVASRIVESTVIAIGLISLLSVVTLRQDFAGTNDATLVAAAGSLVAVHDWTFLIGPGFCVAVGNGMILGAAMWRSGLVPKRLAIFGLVGGPLCFISSVLVLFGGLDQYSSTGGLMAFPEIIWEGGLGIYLILKGFKTPAPPAAAARRRGRFSRGDRPAPALTAS